MTLLEPDLRRTRLEHSHVFYQMTIVVGAEGADEVARRHLGGSTLSAGDILGRKVDNAADGDRRYRGPLGRFRASREISPTSPSGSIAARRLAANGSESCWARHPLANNPGRAKRGR